ncbi:vWA domain-containing protein [Rhizohabitans arisaemae]|uniref:vWA domain-containing protein n=1 Tax=Rhizohabitans arisaemae TaxID=2720610 RepID=UPI0024B0B47B|nr:vWA domain-containing protein [Rhizohabitans arisaemae]
MEIKKYMIFTLIGGTGTYLATALANISDDLGPVTTVLICAGVGLALGAFLTFGRVAAFLGKRLKSLRLSLKDLRDKVLPQLGGLGQRLAAGLLGALLGASIIVVPWGVIKVGGLVGAGLSAPACSRPLVLRLITAPENVRVLRESVARFARTRLVDGCAPYAITVGIAPSIGELQYAFGNNWYRNDVNQERKKPFRRLFGPRPDAWIATSTGEARLAGVQLVTQESAVLRIGPSVASDRLVIGMLGGSAETVKSRLGRTPAKGYPLAKLWRMISTDLKMSVNYPQPELSTAGLVAISDLLGHKGVVDPEQRGVVAESVSSLLCDFMLMNTPKSRGAAESLALVIPHHSLTDYNEGRYDDDRCMGGRPTGEDRLGELISPDLSTLDYPFVTVDWPGETSAERTTGLNLLRDWLVENPLFDTHVPGQSEFEQAVRDSGVLAEARYQFSLLIPRIDAEIVLDVSGSMATKPRSLLIKLREALPGVTQVITPRDDLRLSAFNRPTENSATQVWRLRTTPANRSEFDDLINRVGNVIAGGFDAPISDAIKGVDRRNPRSGRALIVVTDGGPFDKEQDRMKSVGQTLRQAEKVTDLYVLALGYDGCRRSSPVGGKYRTCLTGGAESSEISEALRRLIAEIRTVNRDRQDGRR